MIKIFKDVKYWKLKDLVGQTLAIREFTDEEEGLIIKYAKNEDSGKIYILSVENSKIK